jgi:hypothetical protein
MTPPATETHPQASPFPSRNGRGRIGYPFAGCSLNRPAPCYLEPSKRILRCAQDDKLIAYFVSSLPQETEERG